MELERFWKLFPDRDQLHELTPDAAQAVFRLLMLATFVDDEVTPVERVALAESINRLPGFEKGAYHMLEGQAGIVILANLHDRFLNDLPAVLDEIRAHLASQKERLIALRMVAGILQPDGLEDSEYQFCLTVGSALGLDAQVVTDTVAELWSFAEGD